MNEQGSLARQKNLPGTFSGPNPREVIFETIEHARGGWSWPVEHTGGFSSFHGSTANFLFCDGSVRSLKQSIDTRVYRLLGNRADREPISADSY